MRESQKPLKPWEAIPAPRQSAPTKFSVEASKHLKEFFVYSTGNSLFKAAGFESWDKVLGLSANDCVRSWLKEGLVTHVDERVFLEMRYKVDELRKFCREFGLKISGKKAEVVTRLVEHDPDWAKSLAEADETYRLSPEGKSLYGRLTEELGCESGRLESNLNGLIYDGRFEDAYAAWSDWDRSNAIQSKPEDFPGHRPYTLVAFDSLAKEVFQVLGKGEATRFLVDVLLDRKRLFDQAESGAINREYYSAFLSGSGDHPDFAGYRFIQSPNDRCTFSKHYTGLYKGCDTPNLPPGPCDSEPHCLCFAEVVYSDEVGDEEWKTPLRKHPICNASKFPPKPSEPMTVRNLRELAATVERLGIVSMTEADTLEMIENARRQGRLHDDQGNVIPPITHSKERNNNFWIWLLVIVALLIWWAAKK